MDEINLMSDTVTRPTAGMYQAMMEAPLGDDVFGEDPTINALEKKAAKLFGKEAAVFCPSGTMTNQIAIKVHTKALDELICEESSHVYQYEVGGYSYNSSVAIQLLHGSNGKINAEQIEKAIKPRYDWLPKSKLVVLENSCNKAGGSFYSLNEIKPISKLCQDKGLSLHLDGARIFNVLVETNDSAASHGQYFDSVSICLSKGLGAPVGSLLISNHSIIREARRFRKVMGGGMRQAGILAAAGIYALDHHIDRLKTDNERAFELGQVLQQLEYVKKVRPVQTNILIFELAESIVDESFLNTLKAHGIKAVAMGPGLIRFVTHLDYTSEMQKKVIKVLQSLKFK